MGGVASNRTYCTELPTVSLIKKKKKWFLVQAEQDSGENLEDIKEETFSYTTERNTEILSMKKCNGKNPFL